VNRAAVLAESIKSRLSEADEDLAEFINTRAWKDLDYTDFTTWWEIEIVPIFRELQTLQISLKPEVKELVLAAIAAEDQQRPRLQQRARTQAQRAKLVGEAPTSRGKSRSTKVASAESTDLGEATNPTNVVSLEERRQQRKQTPQSEIDVNEVLNKLLTGINELGRVKFADLTEAEKKKVRQLYMILAKFLGDR